MASNTRRENKTAPVGGTNNSGVLGSGVRDYGFTAMTPQPFQSMPTPQYTYSTVDAGNALYRPESSLSDLSFESQAPFSPMLPTKTPQRANDRSDRGAYGHYNHMMHENLPQERLRQLQGYAPDHSSAVPRGMEMGVSNRQPPNMGMNMGMGGLGMGYGQQDSMAGYGIMGYGGPPGHNGAGSMSTSDDSGGESSASSVLTTIDLKGPEPKSKAGVLANMIKQGGVMYDRDYDESRKNITNGRRGPHRRNTTQDRGGHSRNNSRGGEYENGLSRHQSVHGQNPMYTPMDGMQEDLARQVTNYNPAIMRPLATAPDPPWLHAAITGQYKPTYEQLIGALPFIEPRTYIRPSTAEVIKVGNIPFGASRSEILSCLGPRTRVVYMPPGSPYFSVHIIMERISGKTMDAYVELEDKREVAAIMAQYDKRLYEQRRPFKVGDRVIEIERSSQAALMKELFPRAKCTTWNGNQPVIGATNEEFRPGAFASGFRGFLTSEEMVMTSKHAEVPHRSPYAARSLNRCYESLISTLYKYPWAATDSITLGQRKNIHRCTVIMVRTLVESLRSPIHTQDPTLTPMLLQELTIAVLCCPGFSEAQKAEVVYTLINGGFGDFANPNGHAVRFGGVHPYAAAFPFTVLTLKPDSSREVVEYYASLMRDGRQNVTLAEYAATRAAAEQDKFAAQRPFGNVSIDYGSDTAALSMSEAAKKEWAFLEVLFKSLAGGGVSALQNAFGKMRT